MTETQTKTDLSKVPRGGFRTGFNWRMIGTPAPVFPGFEIDICEPTHTMQKPDVEWHSDRVKSMLKEHPEIRKLIGPERRTLYWCLLCAGAQVGLACAAGLVPWWVMLIVAYVVGSLININLFMLGHECNHSLVFKSTRWNRWLYTLVSLPMGQPGHHTWWIEHHAHHTDLGAKKDFTKRRRTYLLLTPYLTPLFFPFAAMMLVMQLVRSSFGLFLYICGLFVGKFTPGRWTLAVLTDVHLVSGYHKYRFPLWAVTYAALGLGLFAGTYLVAGWQGPVYLLASATFMTGFLHPLLFGMILSNSHFHGAALYQPTSSYYGWFNKLTFNFGLHTEHHDIYSIPWNRLPELKQLAREYYEPLHITKSYSGLAMQFVFGWNENFAKIFDLETQRNVEMLREAELMKSA